MYKRIVGLVLVDNGLVCRTRNFQIDYHYTESHIDTSFFDEMCFIDVTANRSRISNLNFLKTIDKLMVDSQLPLCIGGGTRSMNSIREYRKFGADRYLINQTDESQDSFVKNCIDEFGRSTIVSSINHWGKFLYSHGKQNHKSLLQRIGELNHNCGSEILLNSVEFDGTLGGMDIGTIREISKSSNSSLIISGGLGKYDHALAVLALEGPVAVCTNNIFHLTTKTISMWRAQILSVGGNVRAL